MIDLNRETVLDMKEAARKANVSRKTLYDWRKSGLETAKLGGKRVTSVEALQRFMVQDELETEVLASPVAMERDEILRQLRELHGVTA